MRVWVYPENVYEELGAERWVAETEVVPPRWAVMSEEEREDVDPGCFPIERFAFKGPTARKKAMAKAKRILYRSAFGQVRVQKEIVDWFVEEDRVANWTDAGEPEYVD